MVQLLGYPVDLPILVPGAIGLCAQKRCKTWDCPGRQPVSVVLSGLVRTHRLSCTGKKHLQLQNRSSQSPRRLLVAKSVECAGLAGAFFEVLFRERGPGSRFGGLRGTAVVPARFRECDKTENASQELKVPLRRHRGCHDGSASLDLVKGLLSASTIENVEGSFLWRPSVFVAANPRHAPRC